MVGRTIGKYRMLDRIGRGTAGTVYRALDEMLQREVAIKVLVTELSGPDAATRFRAEAVTVARLNHPGIVAIYDLLQFEDQLLMVMPFVRGETLAQWLERSGAQPSERAADVCIQTLSALAHAHAAGVVHRDLKPANLMLDEAGHVQIMDFGIARVAGTERLTMPGLVMGTPAYMAPEQVSGEDVDARADLYALGVVFFCLLTGQLPFAAKTPYAMVQALVNDPPIPVRRLRPDLPAWTETVIDRALAKRPDERFQSAAEFHQALARHVATPAAAAPAGS